MIGPVLHLELLIGSRRGKLDLLRRAYTIWLILQFFVLAGSEFSEAVVLGSADALGKFVGGYITLLVRQHFFLIVLVTPPFVAGAVADEKSRGTLQDLLIAQLSSWEIVVGKLLGRLAQVGYVALAALPLLAVLAGFGEISFVAVLAVAVVSLAPLFSLSALSILASVWATQTRDAVLRVFLWLAFAVTAGIAASALLPIVTSQPLVIGRSRTWLGWLMEGLHSFNPIHVLDAGWGKHDRDELLVRLLLNGIGWGGIGVVALLLAVWRLRPAFEKQLGAGGRPRGSALVRHSPVDDRPLAWKERELHGIAPLALLRRVPRWVAVLLMAVVCAFLASEWRWQDVAERGTILVLMASLIVGIRASGSICTEREQQTWDTILLTPLAVRTIIRDKQRGILQAAGPYLWFGYAVPSLLLVSLRSPESLAAVLVVVVACWIAMYYMVAAGLWCSVRSMSSWRSLLGTLAIGYGGGLALGFLLSIIGAALGCFCSFILFSGANSPKIPQLYEAILPYLFLAAFVGFQAVTLWHVAESMLESAIRYSIENDRYEWFARYGATSTRPREQEAGP
jgi:ABC-type transport system involved in multi-copper enzyme maturation permease subunit